MRKCYKVIPFGKERSSVSTEKKETKNIRAKILFEMKEGLFSSCEKLPRETELSEALGISRTQLRDSLAELEREGFITRRHGVGTVINRHVLQVKNRMDIEVEFMDMIRQSGYEPEITHVCVQEEPADAHIAEKLGIAEGVPVIRVSRICTADGTPAIYCEDIVEKRLIKGDYRMEDLESPIFSFLQEFCDITAYMDLAELHAVLANDKVAKALEIPAGTPLLNMEEVDFDIEGAIIFYSSQYFRDEYFQQTVLRKKL